MDRVTTYRGQKRRACLGVCFQIVIIVVFPKARHIADKVQGVQGVFLGFLTKLS